VSLGFDQLAQKFVLRLNLLGEPFYRILKVCLRLFHAMKDVGKAIFVARRIYPSNIQE
jgi:hypothetical protein